MRWNAIGRSYDLVARAYEARFLDELRGKPRDRERLAEFAQAVADPVVDVGCGPGQIGAFVRQQGRRVVGVDISPAMARLAARRLDAAMAADMRRLPVGTAAIGGVLAFYSVIHIPRIELGACMTELARVLRPGGRLLLTAHEGDAEIEVDELLGEPVQLAATFFALDELVGAVEVGGFTVVRAERRQPYPQEGRTVRLLVEAVR